MKKGKRFSWVTSSHQHYKQYFPDQPCTVSNTTALPRATRRMFKNNNLENDYFPPNRRHNINVVLRFCLHRCQLCISPPPLLIPLAGCMKRGCHRPLTAKTKHTNLKLDFFGTGNSVKEESQQTDIVGG